MPSDRVPDGDDPEGKQVRQAGISHGLTRSGSLKPSYKRGCCQMSGI